MAKYTEQLDAQITQLLRTRGQATPEMIAGATVEEGRSFLKFYVSAHPEMPLHFDGTTLAPAAEAEFSAPEVREPTHRPPGDGVAPGAGIAGGSVPGENRPTHVSENGTATGEAAALAAAAAARAAAESAPPMGQGPEVGAAQSPDGQLTPGAGPADPGTPAGGGAGLDFEPAAQAGFLKPGEVPPQQAGGPLPDQSPGYRGSSSGGYDPFDGIQPIPEPRTQAVSGWLWLLPLVFGLIGGIIAWAIARDKNPTTARTMLVVGIVIWIVSACLFFSMGGAFGGLAGTTGGGGATDTVWPATGQLTFYYFGTPT